MRRLKATGGGLFLDDSMASMSSSMGMEVQKQAFERKKRIGEEACLAYRNENQNKSTKIYRKIHKAAIYDKNKNVDGTKKVSKLDVE